MGFVDSHLHLDDEAFSEDRDEIIKNLEKEDIDAVFNIACNLESSIKSADLANKYERVYATVGVHPHDASSYNDEVEHELLSLLKKEKVCAIGEIGLDYHYDFSPKDKQREVFIRQLELAKKTNMPAVIHSREAFKDTYDILKEHADGLKVLIHCFTSSPEVMREYLKLGYYIAIGGAVSFKNAKNVVKAAAEIDMGKLLIETDSPYMTPEPYRGRRNEPKYVKLVAQKIAEIRNISTEEVALATKRNALEFFGVIHD